MLGPMESADIDNGLVSRLANWEPREGESLPPAKLAEPIETEPIGDVTVVPGTDESDAWLDAGE